VSSVVSPQIQGPTTESTEVTERAQRGVEVLSKAVDGGGQKRGVSLVL
jgi:hypothetical protein